MRRAPLVLAFALFAIVPAFAQDTGEDNAARIVREQEEFRARTTNQAIAAPATAFDRLESGEPRPAASAPAPNRVKIAKTESSWGTLVWMIPLAGLVIAALVASRMGRHDSR